MIRIDNAQMSDFVRLSTEADPSSIKSLDQTERRVLMSMSTALGRGQQSIEIGGGFSEARLEQIREKLRRPQEVPVTSLLMKVIKAVLNFFGWRIGSQTVREATAEARARGEAITEFRNAYAVPIAQRAKDVSIENKHLLVDEIRSSFPRGLRLPHPPLQFTKDYSRPGFVLRIHDNARGEFQGHASFLWGETPTSYLEFHDRGFNRIFSEEELSWKRLVQAAVAQTLPNLFLMALSNSTIEEMEGRWKRVRHADARGGELILWAGVNGATRNIDVDVIRNSSESIERVAIRLHAQTPVFLRPADRESIPSDTVGHYNSDMSFQLAIDQGEVPQIFDVQCNHVFE